jgi:23S rRNA (cytidine2498-2'-O)-methyltransferase
MNGDMSETPEVSAPPLALWLVRIPAIFEGIVTEVLASFGAVSTKRLGQEYYWIRTPIPEAIRDSGSGIFVRWNLPIEHAWPCQPAKIEGFIEKAAQTLKSKFADRAPQGVFVGALHPTSPDRYFRHLATNLRGRLVLLFPDLPARAVEDQDPDRETLFVLVGKEGLYAGMATPRAANGFYPGGSRYIAQHEPETISRAGAKIAEALHYLRLNRPPLAAGSHWLELGACPGGMTSELLARGLKVTAIDRAPLDPRLRGREGLTFVHDDVVRFVPPSGVTYDALLDDMNGPSEESMGQVIRLSRFLKAGGLVVFTLKVPRIESIGEPLALLRETIDTAGRSGLRLAAKTHLTYNRHEFTLFFERC